MAKFGREKRFKPMFLTKTGLLGHASTTGPASGYARTQVHGITVDYKVSATYTNTVRAEENVYSAGGVNLRRRAKIVGAAVGSYYIGFVQNIASMLTIHYVATAPGERNVRVSHDWPALLDADGGTVPWYDRHAVAKLSNTNEVFINLRDRPLSSLDLRETTLDDP